MIYYNNTSELYHHGIKGQKWGVRRYRNEDGTLTKRGEKRYLKEDNTLTRAGKKRVDKINKREKKLAKSIRKYTSKNQQYQALSKSSKEYVKDDIYNIFKDDKRYNRLLDKYNRLRAEQRDLTMRPILYDKTNEYLKKLQKKVMF